MRLWSVHPQYLDSVGLVALWREGLLAQKVLTGKTKGYRNHPQLDRFKETKDPLKCIGCYLMAVAEEATVRGYNFNSRKILKSAKKPQQIKVTRGQMKYEFDHLLKKVKVRDPDHYKKIKSHKRILSHSMFAIVPGKIHSWERVERKTDYPA